MQQEKFYAMNYEENNAEQSYTISEPAAVSYSNSLHTDASAKNPVMDILEDRIRRNPHGKDCQSYTADELLERIRHITNNHIAGQYFNM